MGSEKEEKKYTIVEKAIVGGAVGGILGALFTGKSEKSLVSAIVGAALSATYHAFNESRKTETGVLYMEGDSLFRALPNGEKKFIKKIPKNKTVVPKKFNLD